MLRGLVAIMVALACGLVRPAAAQDRERLEAFVDGVVVTAMEDQRIPGVVVSVVRDGEVLLEKGYGFARVGEGVRADPATSLFRVASISKTFTATALMQLVEQGSVDLDAPFTNYLPGIEFRLPLGVPRVRDLLTHSAGFEQSYIGHSWSRDAASDHVLVDYVSRYQPVQVRSPGQRVVYSNYGTSVLGLIIERVSGEPYADYMQKHVLDPIGMQRSRFHDWQNAAAEPTLALSYSWSDGRYKAPDWAWMHHGVMPAGGLVATASEMTHFMRAHLGDGSFGAGRLLQPETLARMHRVLIRNHDAVAPNAHGLWAGRIWGYPSLEHGGLIFAFTSNMVLIPELELGIFVSTNASAGSKLIDALPRRMVAEFFPSKFDVPTPAYANAAAIRAALEPFAGDYWGQRRSYTTLEKASGLLGQLSVGFNDAGYLTISGGSDTRRYAALDGDRFASPDSGDVIAFSRDHSGRPVLLHDSYGDNNYDRVGGLDSAGLFKALTGLLVAALAIRLCALWLYRRERLTESGGERFARRATIAVVPVWLVFLWAFVADMTAASGSPTAPHMASYPTTLGWVWVGAGLVGGVLSLLIVFGLIPVWRERHWSLPRRIGFTAYAVLGLSFTALLHHWKLLGLRMP